MCIILRHVLSIYGSIGFICLTILSRARLNMIGLHIHLYELLKLILRIIQPFRLEGL